MSKNRKTRHQKIIADLRRQLSKSQPMYTLSSPSRQNNVIISPYTPPVISTSSTTSFLSHDLRKTALVTVAILSLELFVYFLLTNQILKLSIVEY